jgi:uncharacterized protein
MAERAVPNTIDHDTGGHWQAAKNGELAIRACTNCGLVLHLPKAYCHGCGGWDTEWKAVSPKGTLWSYTVTERELRPGFEPPYTVVVIDLDEAPGTRLIGYLAGRPDLEIGMPFRVRFDKVDDEVTLPQWEPVPA